MILFNKYNNDLLGAVTLDNIRRGPSQVGTLGYWIGQKYSRQGFMHEALKSMVRYAFNSVSLSRLESACLPENIASRGVLEKCDFKYEGVGQYFLQIKGKWEHHILYANICDSRKIRLKN